MSDNKEKSIYKWRSSSFRHYLVFNFDGLNNIFPNSTGKHLPPILAIFVIICVCFTD